MTEQKKSWNLAPLITIFVAAIPVTVGLTQYYITRQTEFRKRFWEEQLVLYREATEAAAEIAIAPDLASAHTAREKFWKLYWGKLSMVEDQGVEKAMISFGAALGACESENEKMCFGIGEGTTPTALRKAAYTLAHCARFSLAMTWNPAGISASVPGAFDPSNAACPYSDSSTPR
jgi:hypothetical protein